jgi:hypothetical protein
MFRTVQGFMETAKLSLMSRPKTVLDLDGAMAWARREHISIVPEQRSAK